jgi:hypothetical protein
MATCTHRPRPYGWLIKTQYCKLNLSCCIGSSVQPEEPRKIDSVNLEEMDPFLSHISWAILSHGHIRIGIYRKFDFTFNDDRNLALSGT